MWLAPPAVAQHGVIREYAARAPLDGATPLQPLFHAPLTDTSITVGHDRAYYLTGSAVSGDGPDFSRQITLWRSTDRRQWTNFREIRLPETAAQSPEIHYLGNRYWLTLGYPHRRRSLPVSRMKMARSTG